MTSLILKCDRATLLDAIDKSKSLRGILKNLGLQSSGASQQILKTRLLNEGIDYISLLGKPGGSLEKVKIENLFTTNSKYARNTIKRYVLRLNLIEYKCKVCNRDPIWNDKPLTLTLDHIDGDNSNNRIDNLRFVCPNCDSQSETYGGRNIKRLRRYCDCGMIIKSKNKTGQCLKCFIGDTLLPRPSKEELLELVWSQPSSELAKYFGVSNKTIRKWCLKYGIDKPGPGYWSKRSSDK